MSSYFVNSTFPVTLPGGGGQAAAAAAAAESFLGQIPLYSSGYAADHPLRHYPGAAAVTAAAAVAYGASGGGGVHQDKPYPASTYYQQAANGAYVGHRAAAGVGVGGATGAGACDYATAAAAAAAAAATSFYRDKDAAGACSLEDHPLALSQDGVHRKAECAGLSGKGLFGEPVDEKQSATPVYPWMQRMNSCNGEFELFFFFFFFS
ncbi:homeobox protein Hox-B6a-like, partial [Centroberyx affinis]|uniref:homeobox protein Hox-B6a-like n=1 Tax=Centroberyx affinis TaxID=166261 RepID=UPI003A5C47DC